MSIWKDVEHIKDHVYKLEIEEGKLVFTKVDTVPENIVELPEGSYGLQNGENLLEGLHIAQGKDFVEIPMEINTVLCNDDEEFYCILTPDIAPGGERELKKVTWCNDDNMYDVIFA